MLIFTQVAAHASSVASVAGTLISGESVSASTGVTLDGRVGMEIATAGTADCLPFPVTGAGGNVVSAAERGAVGLGPS